MSRVVEGRAPIADADKARPDSPERQPRVSAAFVWRHLGAYWRSEGRWVGLAWVLALLALIAIDNRVAVAQNELAKTTMDATQRRDVSALMTGLGWGVLLMAAKAVIGGQQMGGLSEYAKGGLSMAWRRWQTGRTTARWLSFGAFHRIERSRLVDNPDQRIAEDLRLAIDLTLMLLFSLVQTVVALVTFVPRLYRQSGSASVEWAGSAVTVPGFMLWVAVAFSLGLALLTQGVGRRLSRTEAGLEGAEADFRFGLIRVREDAEQIAFYRGSATERTQLGSGFARIRDVWWRLIWQRHLVGFVNGFVQHFDRILPAILFAPRLVSGAATLGDLMQVTLTFGLVVGQLTWFSRVYGDIAHWLGVFRRLGNLEQGLQAGDPAGIERVPAAADRIATTGLQLRRPDGTPLCDLPAFELAPGDRVLVRGPSGVGKSTTLRALAGLWPHGSGRLEMPPAESLMFLPQKPYLPLGTLAAVLSYPSLPETFAADEFREALGAFGLAALGAELAQEAAWHQRLSLGEQQRVAAARVLLQRPSFLIVDEATSALDAAAERTVYRTILERLPGLALLSVAHSPALAAFHDRVVTLKPTVDIPVSTATPHNAAPLPTLP